ncbi:hypothetical protein A3H26_02540 [candidate division WWE3 bacterium RIFCSPLOWO2_12_FULL_36_10]|uniref:DUF5615 domain-containing protein n=1 Tax=candidate division WWE3 bacterium RIFCSPLOWO2_12_FULL_36_10 TaxID=1802630 RepID=A0A1F4VK89_UNCKA|nr:MAG: hypothetical protein A3H26_02540 [candidate division WWE3 bacterium RIFCSPLOWO2_12_FULL_36_10]
MYKILSDECIHKDIIDALRLAGHKITTVHEIKMSGSTDLEVFNYAYKNKLVLFTFDRGFGDIFTFDISGSSGVVIESINQMDKGEIIDIAIAFFSELRDLQGKLVIIGKTKIRIIERQSF